MIKENINTQDYNMSMMIQFKDKNGISLHYVFNLYMVFHICLPGECLLLLLKDIMDLLCKFFQLQEQVQLQEFLKLKNNNIKIKNY